MLTKEKREVMRMAAEPHARINGLTASECVIAHLSGCVLALLDALDETERRLKVAEAALEDHAEGSPVPQCLAARLGEGTLECDATKPCASCRLSNVRAL